MISPSACQRCQEPVELDDAYALHDGLGEAELRRWRCGACGAITEDVVPLDGSLTRVA